MEKPIHQKLKEIRLEAGLTQGGLAEKIGNGGYTKQVISSIETGRRSVGWNVISDWARACGKEAEILFRTMIA